MIHHTGRTLYISKGIKNLEMYGNMADNDDKCNYQPYFQVFAPLEMYHFRPVSTFLYWYIDGERLIDQCIYEWRKMLNKTAGKLCTY